MRSLILGLCAMGLLMNGCAERHRWLQLDTNKYLAYTQPPMDALRPNPVPEATYCTKIVDVTYDPPLERNWFEKLFDIEKPKTFKGCGTREWEQKEGVWLADVKYDTSIIEKVSPMMHGLLFAGATLGAAQILGSHINSGLRGQATGSALQGDMDISTANFFGPGATPNVIRPIGR